MWCDQRRHHGSVRGPRFWNNLSHALGSDGKEKPQLPGVGEADLILEASRERPHSEGLWSEWAGCEGGL